MNQGPLSRWAALLFVACLAVAGCDNDSAFSDPAPGTDPDTGDPDDPVAPIELVDTIVLLADQPVLMSSAIDDEDGTTLTAIARDEDNNVVSGAELNFSADSGALNVLDGETNENGRMTAILTTGGDPRNRTITVTVSGVGEDVEASLTVVVTGTRLQVSGPSSIESQQTEVFDIALVDADDNGIRDVTVEVSSAEGNTVDPASVTTDVNGLASVEVTGTVGGADTLTFEGLGTSATHSILVSEFGIAFIEPSSGAEVDLGSAVDIVAELRELGQPVSGETLEFSATRGTLSALTGTTGGDGRATVELASASGDGAGPVLVTAKGPDDVARTLQFELVATDPDSITLQVEPSTIAPEDSSTVTAIVRDDSGNPVKNQTVRFSLNDTSGGSLTSSTEITNSQGVAVTTYHASTASSPTEGVRITAEVGTPPVASDEAVLTVAQQTLFIVLGTDNRIQKNDEAVTYDKTFTALVTDSAGNPAPPDTVFRLTLRSYEYQKGFMEYDDNDDVWNQVSTIDPNTDPHFGTPNPPPDAGPYFGRGPFGCRSEDPHGTGNINLADDYNNNNQIDPPNVAEVPSTVEIDEDGFATFTVRWPQSYAFWVLARLTATATVAGTENVRKLDFVLPAAAEDISGGDEPPNRFSPFGSGDECADPL